MAATEICQQNGELTEQNTSGDGSNLYDVCCPRCSSIVLRKNMAQLLNTPHALPVFAKKSELTNQTEEFPTDMIDQFWTVNDMYTFENVGFTHDVKGLRYLTCADCELGPIGYQDTSEDPVKVYYVALSRTTHKPTASTAK